jgi:hypothetical protein
VSASPPEYLAAGYPARPGANRARARFRARSTRIVEGLEGLGATKLDGLLAVAPDAPLTPGALLAGVKVVPVPGPDALYALRDLDRHNARSDLPNRVVYGAELRWTP